MLPRKQAALGWTGGGVFDGSIGGGTVLLYLLPSGHNREFPCSVRVCPARSLWQPSWLARIRMSRLFEELDHQQTPLGELTLRRRRMLSLGDLDVFEVKLGDAFLMSSLFHDVEEALANLGLAELADAGPLDVVVGGLGLGYTAVAALEHPAVRSLLVVDALAAVIGWHHRGLVPLGARLTGDPRCRLVLGDFFAFAAAGAPGFDPAQPGRRFHAVLLDIDHSPQNLLHPRHAAFYEPPGLRALAARLHPGGVFALWSDDPPDGALMHSLRGVFASVRAEIVHFPNPLLDTQSASTVYIARLALCPPA